MSAFGQKRTLAGQRKPHTVAGLVKAGKSSLPALAWDRAIKNFFLSIWVELRPFEDFCRHKPWAIPRIRRHLSTEIVSSPYSESLSGQMPSIRFGFGPDDYVASVSAGLPVVRTKLQRFQSPDVHVSFFRNISPCLIACPQHIFCNRSFSPASVVSMASLPSNLHPTEILGSTPTGCT